MSANTKEWFGTWFNSPFYHILYKNRDHQEARQFIDNISQHLNLQPHHKIMDLACGKGRHAIYLNQKGFDVVGLDLSAQNIEHANQYANERLHFYQHDMRTLFKENTFDYVLNLFTSFGYFDSNQENQLAIQRVAQSLKPGGTFLLDFLNPYRVINHLVPTETKTVDGITFQISRTVSPDKYILKNISFNHQGHQYEFQEKVKAIRRTEFLEFFKQTGLTLKSVYGSYNLDAYDPESAERMIFITTKQ